MKRIRASLDRVLARSGFAKNVGVLAGGTLLAHALMASVLPLATRLYAPEAFGLLAAYVATLTIVTGVSSLCLQLAIPIPSQDVEAINLFALAVTFSALTSLCTLVFIVLAPASIIQTILPEGMLPYTWLLPLGIALASLYACTQSWAARKKRFGLIARTRITRAVGGAGTQAGLGFMQVTPLGLLLGHMIYSGMGAFELLRRMLQADTDAVRSISIERMSQALREYRRFPLLTAPEYFFNFAGIQIPVLVIAAIFNEQAGYLLLATQVVTLPMLLIGNSVTQVYLAEAPERMRAGTLEAFTRRTMLTLFLIGAPTLGLVGIAAPFVFPIIFGEQWERAGIIASWLVPAAILQFVASPVSNLLYVTNKQLTALTLQMFGFALRLGAVFAAVSLFPQFIVEAYAASGTLFYLSYVIVLRSIRPTAK